MLDLIIVAIIYTISIVLIFAAICLFKKDIFDKNTFSLFAFGILTLLLATYINSDFITPTKLGDHEKFGQFGDYIGGILNPIFGFLTVILLLRTYEITRSDNLRESRKTEIDELKSIINEFYNSIEKAQNTKSIIFFDKNHALTVNEIYSNPAYGEYADLLKLMVDMIVSDDKANINTFSAETERTMHTIIDLRKNITHVINLYIEIIKRSSSKTVKSYYAIRLDAFLDTQFKFYLLTDHEMVEHKASAKAEVDKS